MAPAKVVDHRVGVLMEQGSDREFQIARSVEWQSDLSVVKTASPVRTDLQIRKLSARIDQYNDLMFRAKLVVSRDDISRRGHG